ncbi:hypothetical protein ACHAXN_004211 [Cyclotella atomus]
MRAAVDQQQIAEEEEAKSLLPKYLYPLVRFHHEDFYVSRSFDPRLIVQLMAEGFLPIATSNFLLPKLHVERCLLQLSPTCNLHISKSTRRKAKNFSLSTNQCFDRVVAGCRAQHGMNWLYPPIVSAFKEINKRTIETNGHGVDAVLVDNDSNERCGTTQVRLYSIEIWDINNNLVAGELGYSVGSIYTSLTGFSNQDNAGSVQLLALGKLLLKCGFTYWDLGMEMDYKMKLGSELMRRADFVRRIHQTRAVNSSTTLQCEGKRNARELIDWDRDNLQRSEFAVTTSSRTSSTVTQASIHEDISNEPIQSETVKHSKKRSHDEDVLEEVKKPASK